MTEIHKRYRLTSLEEPTDEMLHALMEDVGKALSRGGGHEVPISKIISRYYKSLVNASKAISYVDRAYVYDNSVDNQLPRLLYRTTDGQLFKQYTDDIPEWAQALL